MKYLMILFLHGVAFTCAGCAAAVFYAWWAEYIHITSAVLGMAFCLVGMYGAVESLKEF